MSRHARANPDDPISHDWTGGTPDRRERVIEAMRYPAPMADVARAANLACAIARHRNGWPVHHHSAKTQTFGVAT